tara:strand:- start:534 stop:1100 length:567 start_codon:yes stop_codon:yes gene_type:complete
MNKVTETYLVDILRFEMALPDAQVWIKSQNRKIPNTQDLFVIVGSQEPMPFSNTKEIIENAQSEVIQVQQVQMREVVNVDIVSASDEARKRKHEVIMALNSYYAEQVQEANQFRIFEIPQAFLDTGDAEGGSELNRFTLSIVCHSWYRKEKVLESPNGDYYNDFDTRVDDAESIETASGIIEFNITEE